MICYLFPEPAYFFFSSDVPALLYYSHIPSVVVALLVGFFVFLNGRKILLNQLLFAISICFSLWTLVSLVAWTNIHSDILLFAWSFYGVFFSFISILSVYFMYVFLNKVDVSMKMKGIFLVLVTPILIFAPTSLSLGGFNLTACDSFMYEGLIFKGYTNVLGVVAMLWVFVLIFKKYHSATPDFRKQIFLMGVGIELFLFSFFTITFLATYLTKIGVLPDSQLELYGLFGMVVFMTYISFLIVRFKTFSIKLLGAQALIVSLIIVIGSEFFFIHTDINRVLTAITLIITGAIGINLIRSVKKEVAQREQIEKQEKELEVANEHLKELDQLKSEFVSLATHQIRGPLASIKGYASMMIEGDYGEMPDAIKDPVDTIYQSSRSLAVIVDDFLNVSRIEQGKMKYDFADFDLCALASEVVNEAQPAVAKRGLAVSLKTCPEVSNVHGDRGKIKQVIGNLLDNSIKYTPKGSIDVSLSSDKVTGKITLKIKDTGVGIRATTIPHLFQKFSRAEDASKVNILGTGLGLYVAKQMMEAHGGKIWVESEGEGKGSEFFVELKTV